MKKTFSSNTFGRKKSRAESTQSDASKTSIDSEYGLTPNQTQSDEFSFGAGGQESDVISKQKSFMLGQKNANANASGRTIGRKLSALDHGSSKHLLSKGTQFVDDIKKEGFLRKRGHMVKNWKNRFFNLEDGVLRYAEDKGGTASHEVLVMLLFF
jgi:hypothetical protein